MHKQKQITMAKAKKYRILSPDGFDIRMDKFSYSEKEIEKELEGFAKRYEMQGYYSSVKYGRIHLLDIADYCSVVPC